MTGRVLSRPVTLVPILRAGLGMADGVLKRSLARHYPPGLLAIDMKALP